MLRRLLASAMILSTAAFAADGDMDTTYNTPNGFNAVSFGASDNVYGGFLQPDGKFLVIGGGRPVTNQEMSVARFNADGTLDTATFGGGTGKFSIDVNPATTTDRGTCGGLQSDGKIIIGGYSRTGSGNDDYAIIRLNTNGTLDTTFGTSGITKVDFNGGTDRANALVVLSDNSIVIAGMSSDFNLSPDIDYSVAKLTPNGALDSSFGTAGKVTVDVGEQQDSANGLTVQSDGRIIFCGQSFAANGDNIAVVGRLTPTGVVDPSFGGGDGLYTARAAVPYAMNDVKVQSDGMVVVCGTANVSTQLDGLVLRLTSAGDLDAGFNTTGILTLPLGTLTDAFYSLIIQADGKIIAGGFWQNPGPNVLETVLIRVNTNGTLDSGFATGGIKKLLVGSGQNRPVSIRQAADGKILVALESGATSAENFTAARFQNTVSVATAPEIAVTESAANVADGGSLSFGTTTVGTPVTKTFTVTNSGTATLNLSALSVPLGFTITQNFASSTVAAGGGTTTFQITMSAASAGSPSGTLTFTNNDADEGSYDFTISGTVNPAPQNVTVTVPAGVGFTLNGTPYTGSQTVPLPPGTYTLSTTTPQTLGAGTRAVFSSWSDLGAISHSITVLASPLSITGSFITQYQLTTAASPGAGGTVTPASGTFFDSGTVVSVSATANSGYVFSNWTGAVANASSAATTVTMDAAKSITANFTATAPEIAVSYNSNNIADGSAVLNTTIGTDFGSTPVQGGVVQRTFTITNSGTGNLTLGTVGVTGSGSAHFAVTQPVTTTVTPSSSTTFTVTYDPSAAGTHSALVSFTNNDADEGTFDFGIVGTGTGPRTFDLAGNAVTNTPFDGGETYIYTPVTAEIPMSLSSGTLTIDATGSPGAANTSVTIVDLGGGVLVLEIKDLTRTI
ncbi:MAG: choice-of-anchor D domain-containing protein, partial [Verrucomicrobiaceae bacterium]|nr:choice-of-anchor D domain-containing protein [Verrucomicrobiaceae bacterium]